MKKLYSYILIIIILSGFLVPIHSGLTITCTPPEVPSSDGSSCVPPPTTTPSQNYQLLSPLPCTGNTTGCKDGKLETFDPTGEGGGALGGYLNLMIKLFIGICAVLAVIMIVIGGMEYMTSELISSKEHGKEKIVGAIMGLLLALGAYTLLYTINPNLLNSDFKSLEEAIVKVSLDEAIPSDNGTPPGATLDCLSGIKKTNISMFACTDIVQKINTMLADSKLSGLNITGGGYRSVQEQFDLRTKHCGAGNETSPTAVCRPPTALPGQSNHNNGKAFDLKCDGVFIQTSDNKCFAWLKTNGSKYGLYNLPSEPWHWSVDGH